MVVPYGLQNQQGISLRKMLFTFEKDKRGPLMPDQSNKGLLSAFWDWFVLFSGISTASNLSRTRPDPVRRRGLFLFRKSKRS
jgi:hypothetical protein